MRPLFLFLLLAGFVHAQLKFESDHISAEPDPNKSTYEVIFPFSVSEDTSIARLKTTCSCISAIITPEKKEWKKGETGTITSTLDLSQIRGRQTKNLGIIYSDGSRKDLSVTIDMPNVITSSPKSHKWKIGETASPKTFEITILPGFDLEITEVLVSNKHFDFELTPVEKETEKKYTLTVQPKDLNKRQICSFRLKTNSKVMRYQMITVLALIAE